MLDAPEKDGLVFDIHRGAAVPLPMNAFDRSFAWIMTILAVTFTTCAVVSGYATFSGFRLFLQETGDDGALVNGTSVILTIAIVTILAVGWYLICSYGPEARTPCAKGLMVLLGAAFLAITLCVSSLPNVLTLVGPSSKVAHWKQGHAQATKYLDALSERALSVKALKASWQAERGKNCSLAGAELKGGTLSLSGAGKGPVAAALIGACEQTTSFIKSADQAVIDVTAAVERAREALRAVSLAIRDRDRAVIDREDDYLDASEVFNAQVQLIKTADMSRVLKAGTEQIRQGVAELGPGSSFSSKQVEMVAATRQSLSGLVASANAIAGRWDQEELPPYEPLTSPDYIAAIVLHWDKFVPAVAAAIGIDCFQVWALFFLMTSKMGKGRFRLKSDFEEFLGVDPFVPLTALTNKDGEPVPNSRARDRSTFIERLRGRLRR